MAKEKRKRHIGGTTGASLVCALGVIVPALAGAGIFAGAKSAIHEIAGILFWVIAAVFFAAGIVANVVSRAAAEVINAQGEREAE